MRCNTRSSRLLQFAAATLVVGSACGLVRADEAVGNPPVLQETDGNTGPSTQPVRTSGPATQEVPASAADWAAVESFMRQNSPNKWKMYQSLPDRPLKQGLRKQVLQRFRAMERVRIADAKRWALEVRAVALEDDIYGILQELRNGKDEQSSDDLLREKIDELLQNRDTWRLERLARVRTELISLKLPQAVPAVESEINRLTEMNSDSRRNRVDKRLDDLKKHVNRPQRPFLGGRTPESDVPNAETPSETPNPQ